MTQRKIIEVPLAALSLSLVGGCATTHPIQPQVAASVDFSNAETYAVSLESFHFHPHDLQLQAGKRYALRLTNTAGASHNFTAPEFFAAARVKPEDAPKIANGQVELKPGQTAVVHLIPSRGQYGLVCTHTGHSLLGMSGKIFVS